MAQTAEVHYVISYNGTDSRSALSSLVCVSSSCSSMILCDINWRLTV